MKTIAMTMTALALLTTLAQAADDALKAKGLFLAGLYNRDCSKIPDYETMLKQFLAAIPRNAMLAGIEQAGAEYRSMATPTFCKIYKPIVDAYAKP
jgi:hypothetical protein